ncbi:MAG: Uma2 family endonuclease [Chloroflexi bacterium]|nr:MAG: Uma2 family endonuclease [Chloroflexota bacterium]
MTAIKAQFTPIQATEKLTFEEFLQTYMDVHAELVNGDVQIMTPATDKHQDLVGWLSSIMRLFAETHGLGVVRSAPLTMRIPGKDAHGREPDIMFISQERMNILKPTYLAEPADLVIEIISPESVGRDRGEKFVEYEAAGVREYWLIDPDREQAEFYQLADDGRYRLQPTPDGRYESQILPGFWLNVMWLWQEPLPKILDVARQLGLL